MEHDPHNSTQAPRSGSIEKGCWELQILESPRWMPGAAETTGCTAVLLCPGPDEPPEITDYLQHEFRDTAWRTVTLPPGPRRLEQLQQGLPQAHGSTPWVIYVGAVNVDTASEIESILRQLRQERPDDCFIVCCDHRHVRRQMPSATGYVRHGVVTTCHETLCLAAMLHRALSLPVENACTDMEDVKMALGCAEQPSLLGEAARHHGMNRLYFAVGTPFDIFDDAEAVFVFIDRPTRLLDLKRCIEPLQKMMPMYTLLFLAWAKNDLEQSAQMLGPMDRIRLLVRPRKNGAT